MGADIVVLFRWIRRAKAGGFAEVWVTDCRILTDWECQMRFWWVRGGGNGPGILVGWPAGGRIVEGDKAERYIHTDLEEGSTSQHDKCCETLYLPNLPAYWPES